jgi:hypothetical protein
MGEERFESPIARGRLGDERQNDNIIDLREKADEAVN